MDIEIIYQVYEKCQEGNNATTRQRQGIKINNTFTSFDNLQRHNSCDIRLFLVE